MSHQLTFADSEFSTKRRQTRKEIFLSRMEQILPWQNMTAVIEPFIPRRAMADGLSAGDHAAYSLHAALVQPERRCHGRCPVRNRLHAPVCPIILDSALPDRTTIMNFRHLLEQHQLARQLFKTINRWLAEAGVMMTKGTLVDATIIEAALPRTKSSNAIRRCIRPRKAISGTLA